MPELVDDLGSAGRKLTPSPTSTVRLKPISTSVHIRARMISDAATPIRTRRIVLIIILPKQISIPKLLRLRSLAARSDEAMACDPAEPTLPVVLLASGTSDPAWHIPWYKVLLRSFSRSNRHRAKMAAKGGVPIWRSTGRGRVRWWRLCF